MLFLPLSLIGVLLLCNLFVKKYEVGVTIEEISEITIYYTNEACKKNIDRSEDVATILNALNDMGIRGQYDSQDSLPAGGQTFFLFFHMNDGQKREYVYYQTSESSGYFSDGTNQRVVSKFNLIKIWKDLTYEAIDVIEGDESVILSTN